VLIKTKGVKFVNKAQKQELIAHWRDQWQQAGLVVLVRQTGLTVSEMTDLRRKMRAENASFRIVKNTLAKRAVTGTPMEDLSSSFMGPVGVAFSDDPIAAAKVVEKFASSNDKVKILGGYMNGQILNENNVKSLAKLPSLDEQRSILIGILNAPATKIARLLKEPGAQIARVLSAYSKKD
jgi:large subunit ribosomal protein L10